MENSQLNTYQALVSGFCEFLLVAVHTILAERDVYPKNSFIKARKWGSAVFQSRHPSVVQWINDAVAAVEKQLLKATVREVSLVIFSASSAPLERFVFNTSRFPIVSESDLLTPFSDLRDESSGELQVGEPAAALSTLIPDAPVVDLNAQFRGLLSRLCQSSQSLGPLPPKCTFTIAIEMRDKPQGRPPIERLSAFIPSETHLRNPGPHATRTTPLRSVDAGAFLMETWVEETQTKLDEAAKIIAQGGPKDDEDEEKRPERPVDPLLEAMEGRTYVM